ncbi:hypothetical protein [Streptomyces sp. NPDC005953]|uniref:hypothetical protein n=1 Tax=Streptomyces sp. NPDC005953 TaxID=3156719 RepID=UPI0033FB4A3E
MRWDPGLALSGLPENSEDIGGIRDKNAQAAASVAARAAEGSDYRRIVIGDGSTAGTPALTLGRAATRVRHP